MTDKKAKEDTSDPYEDIENIPRSFPNRVDQTGTPDTQPDQPAEALGVQQVSVDSVKKEAEALQDLADKSGNKKSGLAEVSEEDRANAAADVKDGSMIEGGHDDRAKKEMENALEKAKENDSKAEAREEQRSAGVPEADQSTKVEDSKATKAAESKPAAKK